MTLGCGTDSTQHLKFKCPLWNHGISWARGSGTFPPVLEPSEPLLTVSAELPTRFPPDPELTSS